jgi:hypothetical protein
MRRAINRKNSREREGLTRLKELKQTLQSIAAAQEQKKCPPRNDRSVATLVAKAKSSSTLKTYRFVNGATGATSIAAPRCGQACNNCGAGSLEPGADKIIDEVFQREQDKRVALGRA